MPVTDSLASLIAREHQQVVDAFTPPPVCHDDMMVTWHPVALAAAAAEAFSERLLDAIYAAEPSLLQQAHITVACPALPDGLGDITLAWRVCAWLLRHADTAQITLVVPDPGTAERLRDGVGPVNLVSAASASGSIARCDLLVVAPDPAAARYSAASIQAWLEEASQRYPTLAVSEYGSGAPRHTRWRTLATGLGPMCDGIFIDPHVARAARTYRHAPPATRQDAMRAWASATLQGVHHADWQALHLLYVREPEALQWAIGRALAAHPGDAEKLLMLVLRHALTDAEVSAWRRAGHHVMLNAGLSGRNLACAQMVSIDSLTPAAFRMGLVHADFAIVTGDQSLSEAIAAQTPFAYEVRTHKQSFAHRLQEVASRFGPETHRAMAPLADGSPPAPAPVAAWQAMCGYVCDAYDVGPRLVGRAARTLHATQGHRALESAIAQACPDAQAPAGQAHLVLLLERLQASLRLQVGTAVL